MEGRRRGGRRAAGFGPRGRKVGREGRTGGRGPREARPGFGENGLRPGSAWRPQGPKSRSCGASETEAAGCLCCSTQALQRHSLKKFLTTTALYELHNATAPPCPSRGLRALIAASRTREIPTPSAPGHVRQRQLGFPQADAEAHPAQDERGVVVGDVHGLGLRNAMGLIPSETAGSGDPLLEQNETARTAASASGASRGHTHINRGQGAGPAAVARRRAARGRRPAPGRGAPAGRARRRTRAHGCLLRGDSLENDARWRERRGRGQRRVLWWSQPPLFSCCGGALRRHGGRTPYKLSSSCSTHVRW